MHSILVCNVYLGTYVDWKIFINANHKNIKTVYNIELNGRTVKKYMY